MFTGLIQRVGRFQGLRRREGGWSLACTHEPWETALEIGNLRYFGSQPWPYPCGVMIGFTADYVAGEIRIQEEELASAAWFHRDALPELPMKLSLARRLLDAWLERG